MPVHPRFVEGAARAEPGAQVNDNYTGYETYQGRAGNRTIPVVLLDPTPPVASRTSES
jgi:hypothetical protein